MIAVFTTSGSVIKDYFCDSLQARLSFSRLRREGGKSGQHRAMHPDNIGGTLTNAEKYVEVTDSATENDRLFPSPLVERG